MKGMELAQAAVQNNPGNAAVLSAAQTYLYAQALTVRRKETQWKQVAEQLERNLQKKVKLS